MMDVREVRVGFRKTVSDGQYGNETYEVSLYADLSQDEDADPVGTGHFLAGLARVLVLEHLARSKSDAVRDALMTADEREARWKAESARRRRELDAARPGAEGA